MKYKLLFGVLIILHFTTFATSRTDSLLKELRAAINNSQLYDEEKNKTINSLKEQLTGLGKFDLTGQFNIYNKLFEEYRVYNYDTAYYYTQKMIQIGRKLNNNSFLALANLNLGFIHLSSGMFKESIEVLNAINVKVLPDSSKADYYSLLGRYYYDLSDYNYNGVFAIDYKDKAGKYIDSSLALYPSTSFQYNYYLGLKNLKTGSADKAFVAFNNIINNIHNLSAHDYALVTSTLSGLYVQKKDFDNAIIFLLEAGIADIKSSTKETTALLYSAGLLFNKGDSHNALMCIKKANADAQFYGARQRKIQIGSILPIIEGQVINTIEVQKRNLLYYAFVVTGLFLTVIVLVAIIYTQLKKLKTAKDAITKAHLKEKEINQLLNEANIIKEHFNQQLKATNYQLKESNKIKEEYIGYFFHADYKFIEKFEKFKSLIEKKMLERKFDEIRFLIQNTNLKLEKEELLVTFDKIFMKLFPNFVQEFNALFTKENQIILKDNEVLNTELRIFALMRIGISDNEKIAQILDYSVNTIYTYKTKIRNKSLVANDEFDEKLNKATTLDI